MPPNHRTAFDAGRAVCYDWSVAGPTRVNAGRWVFPSIMKLRSWSHRMAIASALLMVTSGSEAAVQQTGTTDGTAQLETGSSQAGKRNRYTSEERK
jgi:hypothetical protein